MNTQANSKEFKPIDSTFICNVSAYGILEVCLYIPLIDPFHNNIQFEAKDVIPSVQREIYIVSLCCNYTYKTISCVAESKARF